ncbi:MAG: PAS domain S-box protein, partial [Rhodospirillales bacterium]
SARFFNLKRHYSITSAVVIACVTLLLTWNYRAAEESELSGWAVTTNSVLVKTFGNTYWPEFDQAITLAENTDAVSLRKEPSIIRIGEYFETVTHGLPIMKIRLYNLNGLIVYSTAPKEIGRFRSGSLKGIETAKQGVISSELIHIENPPNYTRATLGKDAPFIEDGQNQSGKNQISWFHDALNNFFFLGNRIPVAVSRIPIGVKPGEPQAVFEIRTDVSQEALNIAYNTLYVFMGLIFTFGSLYGVLFFIVHRADAIMRDQYTSLEHSQTGMRLKNILLQREINEREEAEKALRQSELRFRGAIEGLQEGFALFDASDKLLAYNDEYVRLHDEVRDLIAPGVPYETIFRAQVLAGIFPEARGREPEFVESWLEGRLNGRFGTAIRTLSNGLSFIVLKSKMPDGGIFATYTDITQIQQANKRFRSLVESAPDAIVMVDESGIIVTINHRFTEMFGYSEKEAVGRKIEMLVPVPLRHKHAHLRNLLDIDNSSGRTMGFGRDITGLTKDGREISVEINLALVDTDEGQMISGSIRDISKRKIAEEEIKKQKTLFEAVFNNAPYALVMTDMDREVVLCNPAFTFMFGYTAEEFAGKSIAHLYESKEEFEKWNHLRNLLDDDYSHNSYRGRYKRKSGETFSGETAMATIGSPDDKIFGFIGIIQDISDRVRREEENRRYRDVVSHSRRLNLLGEMAAGLAHEINQPLAAIANYTEGCIHRLKTGGEDTGKVLEALQRVSDQADRAGKIISRIRGFVKQQGVAKAPTNVEEMVQEAIALIENDIERLKITLVTDFEDNGRNVVADKVQIQQVILNLIRNAGDAMEEHNSPKRVIRIQTTAPAGKVVEIAVSDTGPGIDENNLRCIFAPFFTTKSSGLGLGLNICQSIVENHGGNMWATSIHGQGATIHFTLPVAAKTKRKEKRYVA